MFRFVLTIYVLQNLQEMAFLSGTKTQKNQFVSRVNIANRKDISGNC